MRQISGSGREETELGLGRGEREGPASPSPRALRVSCPVDGSCPFDQSTVGHDAVRPWRDDGPIIDMRHDHVHRAIGGRHVKPDASTRHGHTGRIRDCRFHHGITRGMENRTGPNWPRPVWVDVLRGFRRGIGPREPRRTVRHGRFRPRPRGPVARAIVIGANATHDPHTVGG